MESPLWIDRYAPTLGELPQPHLRRYLEEASERPINLLLYGPPGAGKTAAVRALSAVAHEDPDRDLLILNLEDFFGRTKREIEDDPRFRRFFSDSTRRSKREMINHVFRESTAHAPISGRFRTVLLDNAEAVREDFQQSLRRLIERHHQTTQFIITTKQLGALIPALQSRCLPVPVPPPADEFVIDRLEFVLQAEEIEYEDAALALLSQEANGNLRRALLGAQATYVRGLREDDPRISEDAVFETLRSIGPSQLVEDLLERAERGSFDDARSQLDDLLVEEGLTGAELLDEVLKVGRTRYSPETLAWLTREVAETDFLLATGGDDRVQLSRLLADLGSKPLPG